METNTCSTCGIVKPKKYFAKNRRQCHHCKTAQLQKRVSGSYELYLKNLFTNAKSQHGTGSRSTDREWTLVYEDVLELWEKQEGRCALSGVFLTHHKDGLGKKDYNASLDRISQNGGYTPDNVQLVCFRVNIMKHNLTEDLFYWWTKTINDFSCD
tara:strand:- start:637 stop:1101 length:465 start_codon:yes stop_codon:yes gene_type:complete